MWLKSIFFLLIWFLACDNDSLSQKIERIDQTYDTIIKLDFDCMYNSKAFSIYDSVSKKTCLTFVKGKKINSYILDENFKIESVLKNKIPELKDMGYAGQCSKQGQFYFYLSDSDNINWMLLNVNPDSSKISIKKFNIQFDQEEVFINNITVNESLVFLNVIKRSSIIHLLELKTDGSVKQNYFNLDNMYNFKEKLKSGDLYHCLLENELAIKKIVSVDVISDDFFSSSNSQFHDASNLNKIYCYEDNIFLTLDKEGNTALFSIDLKNFTFSVKDYINRIENDTSKCKSNSFLFNSFLYQVCINNNKLYLKITDIHTSEIIASYLADKDQGIFFKNTPFIQEGGSMTSEGERELEKNAQFFRKVNKSVPCIFSEPLLNNIKITIGAIQEFQNSTPGPVVGMPIGGGVSVSVGGGSGYSSTRIVYFNSIFDKKGMFLEKEIIDPVYKTCKYKRDRFIEFYSKPAHSTIKLETKDKFIYGFDPQEINGGYFLYIFKNCCL